MMLACGNVDIMKTVCTLISSNIIAVPAGLHLNTWYAWFFWYGFRIPDDASKILVFPFTFNMKNIECH